MIIGYFENGRPHVSAHVEIPRLNIRDTIPLLVDTGADITCIHPKDGTQLLIPYQMLNRPTTVRGVAGSSQRYLENAVFSFRDSWGIPYTATASQSASESQRTWTRDCHPCSGKTYSRIGERSMSPPSAGWSSS